jgi:hypothetical protein
MAFMHTNYVKSRPKAKAIIRYIQHRRGKDGAKLTRTLFGNDGVMSTRQAYRMIDEAAKGTNFFRIIISPDPAQEDTRQDLHLREITQQTILHLEERLHKPILYVAAEHADHAPHRHVHVLALVRGRVEREDVAALRETATHLAVLQRQERDAALKQERHREEELAWEW